jgi:hypothetical protein
MDTPRILPTASLSQTKDQHHEVQSGKGNKNFYGAVNNFSLKLILHQEEELLPS